MKKFIEKQVVRGSITRTNLKEGTDNKGNKTFNMYINILSDYKKPPISMMFNGNRINMLLKDLNSQNLKVGDQIEIYCDVVIDDEREYNGKKYIPYYLNNVTKINIFR